MKKVVLILSSIVICLCVSTSLSFAKDLADYTLSTIPIPEYIKEVKQKVDIAKNDIYSLIDKWGNSSLKHADPFYFDRKSKSVPDYAFRQFESSEHPRKIYLFYKDFYDTLGGSRATSCLHFDVENEEDDPAYCKDKDAVFYRININSSGKNFDMLAMKPDNLGKTIVYIFSYTK